MFHIKNDVDDSFASNKIADYKITISQLYKIHIFDEHSNTLTFGLYKTKTFGKREVILYYTQLNLVIYLHYYTVLYF